MPSAGGLASSTLNAMSSTMAGQGSCARSSNVTAWRTSAIASPCQSLSPNCGAKPAATSMALRSRSGRSSASARRSTISVLGLERSDSMKERWRVDTSALSARSSWLIPRSPRHSLSIVLNMQASLTRR
jgi:hypothetical protein